MMKLSLLVVALLLVAAHAGSMEQLLTPSVNDAKDTTDAEILNAVDNHAAQYIAKGAADDKKSAQKDLAKKAEQDVDKILAESKAEDAEDEGDQVVADALGSDAHLFDEKKSDATTAPGSTRAPAPTADPNDYLNMDEKMLLASYEVDWRAIEKQHVPHMQVTALLERLRANDYLSAEEKKMLHHYGYNFRVLEEQHVSKAEVDRRLALLIKSEHKEIFNEVYKQHLEAHRRSQAYLEQLERARAAQMTTTAAPTAPPTPEPAPTTAAPTAAPEPAPTDAPTEAPTTAPANPRSVLGDHLVEVLESFGYDPVKIVEMGLTPEQVMAKLKDEALDIQREVREKLEQDLSHVDSSVQAEYQAALKHAEEAIEKMAKVDGTIVKEAGKVKREGEALIQEIEAKAQETVHQLTKDAEIKEKEVDEEATEKKKEIVAEDQSEWKAFKAKADQEMQATQKKIQEEVAKASSVNAATAEWFEKKEKPELEKITATAEQKDILLRHEAKVQAEYKLLQLRSVLPPDAALEIQPIVVPKEGLVVEPVPDLHLPQAPVAGPPPQQPPQQFVAPQPAPQPQPPAQPRPVQRMPPPRQPYPGQRSYAQQPQRVARPMPVGAPRRG